MGIEDRDYTRDSSDYTGTLTGFGLDYIPPMVKWLIVANVVVFLLQIFVSRTATPADWNKHVSQQPREQRRMLENPPAEMKDYAEDQRAEFLSRPISLIEEWLQLDAQLVVFRGQVWRLLTFAFCHNREDLFHILLNMLALYWCGVTLESLLGPRSSCCSTWWGPCFPEWWRSLSISTSRARCP